MQGPNPFFRLNPADLKKPKCFAVKRGEIKRRIDCQFHLPEHKLLGNKLTQANYPCYKIGDEKISVNIVDGPFGSQLKVEDYCEKGVTLVRVSNCRTGEIVEDDGLVFIQEDKHKQLKRSEVLPGDVLLTKAGSLGYTAVFPESLQKGNITSHLAAIRPNSQVMPMYLALYLSSSIGTRQIYRWGNKTTRPELNTEEVREIKVILPPLSIQRVLVGQMEEARKLQKSKLDKSNYLLSGLDSYILEIIGIVPHVNHRRNIFAIKLSQIDGPINPERYQVLQLEKNIKGISINDVAEVVKEKVCPGTKGPNEEWDLIRIDDLANKPIDVTTVRTNVGSNFEGAYFAVQENDILLARLGPTIMNQKIVLCPKQYRQTIASPEFIVLRCKKGWDPLVVLWVLRTSLYREIIYSKCRGTTPSRYRVTHEDLSLLPFPEIDDNKQSYLSVEIKNRLALIRQLKEDAKNTWDMAKVNFEAQLLGDASS